MNDPIVAATVPAPAARRGSAVSAAIAWLVIIASCGHVVWHANLPPEAAAVEAQQQRLTLSAELTAKLCVGLGQWSPDLQEMILSQARSLEDEGRIGQAAHVVLAAELTGLDEALQELDALRADLPNESSAATRATVESLTSVFDRIYRAPGAGTAPASISEDDRALLVTHMGWVGRLAPLVKPLADGAPERVALLKPLAMLPTAMMAFIGWGSVCALAGLAGMITLLVLGLQGRLRHGFVAGCGNGAIYAEVFALWIAIFVGGKMLAEEFEWDGLSISLGLTVGGLVLALCWAMVRGVGWSQMRSDLGLHAGRGVVKECMAGMLTYCMAIPMLVVALMVTMVLMAIQKQFTPGAPGPSHPVQELVASGDWKVILETMIFASIIAPLVEETIFRGALFRHLRDATAKLGTIGSFLTSGLVSSVLFAAIHPQGWVFIPVLSSLALAFCVGREWRGSLLPGMVAHGLNNFVIMTLNVLLLGQG